MAEPAADPKKTVADAPAAAAAASAEPDDDSSSASSSGSGGGASDAGSAAEDAPKWARRHEPGTVTKVIKIGVMGDGTVGKTTFLLTYITQGFVSDYTPTVFDNFSAIEEIGGDVINVILWDLAGQDEYTAVRSTCYSSCNYDVVLLCFSVVHRDSFENLKHKWYPELKSILQSTPFLLVGTKTDLRPPLAIESSPTMISRREAEKRAKELKAYKYVECTAKEPSTVISMIREAINIILERDVVRKEKIFKQYKKERKAEEKLEAKMAKHRAKEEARAAASAAAAGSPKGLPAAPAAPAAPGGAAPQSSAH
eukprot:m51a1_g11705 putative rho gtpase (311) ;mRNA; r:46458-48081